LGSDLHQICEEVDQLLSLSPNAPVKFQVYLFISKPESLKFDNVENVCMYIRLKQLTNRNIDNTDNKRESKR